MGWAELRRSGLGSAGLSWAGLALGGLALAMCERACLLHDQQENSSNSTRCSPLPSDPKLWQFIRHAPCHKWKHHIQTWAHKTSECKIIQLRTEEYQHPLANYSRHAYLPSFFYARKSRPSQDHMHTTHTSRVVHARAHTTNVMEPTKRNRANEIVSGDYE